MTLHYQYNYTKMRRYLIIYEKGKDGYSAYVPDLLGCTSAGGTKKEVEENIVDAINLHIEVMKEAGYEIPETNSESEMLVLA
jgi:predicted RNase H-like HicB family nuclease